MNPMEDKLVEVVRQCYECKKKMVGRRENYQYTEAGLKSVTLTNVLVFHCDCGAIVAEIPAIGQLHWRIAMDLFRKESILSGEEVRFLRKWVGYSATELAETSSYTKASISRWETGKTEMSRDSDRLLRLVFFAKMIERIVGNSIKVEGQCLPNKVAEIARVVQSLNLPDILRKVEDEHRGSMPLRINPETLTDAVIPEGGVSQPLQ